MMEADYWMDEQGIAAEKGRDYKCSLIRRLKGITINQLTIGVTLDG